MKSQFFSREFLESLPEDNDDAIVALSNEYVRLRNFGGDEPKYDHDFLEAYAILQAFIEARSLNIPLPTATPPTVDRQGIGLLLKMKKVEAESRIHQRESTFHFERKSDEYRAMFSKTPAYEFSDDDYIRMQELVNECRVVFKTGMFCS